MLDQAGFDDFVERVCSRFYDQALGRPSLPPGVYFRMLLLGYLMGFESERRIALQAADSLSLRQFLGYGLHEATPDHSTLSKTRKRIALEAHEEVFGWVLERLREAGCLRVQPGGADEVGHGDRYTPHPARTRAAVGRQPGFRLLFAIRNRP